MASTEAEPSTAPQEGPPSPSSAAMISNLLSKLKPPNILRDPAWIPRFRDTCFPPPAVPPQQQQHADEAPNKEEEACSEDEPTPTSWQHHLAPAPPEAYTSAFSSLLTGRSMPPSLVWFGEQHHQPHVIRAQIQLLAALADHLEEAAAAKSNAAPPSAPSTSQPPPRPHVRYHLHLLMEHFSLLDQPLLDRFHSGLLDIGELCAAYRQRSDEKFQVEMYAPLLLLARERGAQVWGGFPPRGWARRVVKEGVEGVRGLEGERVRRGEAGLEGEEEGKAQSLPPTTVGEASPLPQPLIPLPPLSTSARRSLPLFTSWSHVIHLSRSHRSFLDSLMKPHLPPYFPRLPADSGLEPGSTSVRCPTEKLDLNPPPAVTKGFAPAQALKDAYLAHAASSLLREGHVLAGHSAAEDKGEDVEHRNIVMVVAGLGHVQAGFGAPERVVMLGGEKAGGGAVVAEGLKEDGGKEAKESLIVLSMPRDSSLWLGAEWKAPATRQEGESRLAPAATPATAHEDAGMAKAATAAAAAAPSGKAVIPEGWDRKLADAIVLYDWIDLEKETSPPPPSTKPAPISTTLLPAAASADAAPQAAAAAAGQGAEQKDRGAGREGKGEKKSS